MSRVTPVDCCEENIVSCSHSDSCELYVQFAMEPSLKLWKEHFCDGDFDRCSRFQLALTGKPVPLGLLPNGKELQMAVRSKEELGGTALFNAIVKNRVGMVKAFMKSGAISPDIRTPDGLTPLMAAASVGNMEIVQLFLEHGCNPLHKNHHGEMAADIAESRGFSECAVLLREHMLKAPPVPEPKSETAADEQPTASSGGFAEMLGFLRRLNPLKRQNAASGDA